VVIDICPYGYYMVGVTVMEIGFSDCKSRRVFGFGCFFGLMSTESFVDVNSIWLWELIEEF